jgi:hypothetical protein
LRRAPAKPKPRAVSKPLSIGWSGNVSASARRSSSGPTRRSPRVGVRAIRLIQGVLQLTRRHPRERVLAAVAEAHTHQHFRYQTIRQLVERTPVRPTPALATDDPAIRPMTQYTLEDFLP